MTTRVLIVDDRPTNLRIYAQFVTIMGEKYSAVTFADPVEALHWLRNNSADLLIVDYRMPQMNGAEFIKKVRSMSTGNDVPAIVITAHQDRECRLSALDAGATDFLQSPVSHVEFCNRAMSLLSKSEKSVNLRQRASEIERKHAAVGEQAEDTNTGKSMLEQIIDTIPIMINATDRSGKCLFTNAYQSALFDKTPDQMVGHEFSDFLEPQLKRNSDRRNDIVLKSGQAIPHYEEKFTSDGVDLIFHCNKSPLLNHKGETIGVLTTAVDITARKFAEEHRTHLALHDMLTGLPNRVLLAEKVRTAIETCTNSEEEAALLLLDLDRFKTINDTRGHHTGDTLLREVAERLTSILGPSDFAARIGGDEFAIILNNISGAETINSRCLKILSAINEPYSISGVDQVIGASIGVSLIPEDGNEYEELLRMADLAMYDAKANGRNCHRFFSEGMNQIAQANAALENELRDAISQKQFALEYQPIVDAKSLEYVGLEALIRWDHPKKGRLLPQQFIQVADDTGLMDILGKWVIGEVCRQIRVSEEDGIILPRVAINVSPRQFQNQNVCEEILRNIEENGIEPSKIVVEITEELLLDNNERVSNTLNKLRNAGVGISIDDFGTGYSSLQYLRDLPANCLKIDRTFISRIEHSPADRAIIGTIAHLAHALDMRVIAEGVENDAQLELLKVSGCDEIQGFKIARPQKADDLPRLFENAGFGTARSAGGS
ncbi:PAS domain S-box-containing protein/diguanylate cyclase (GGDEF) domain-containing protein [Parasphingorhabdus marina DSM 22363]|uniref:PAS domain S-box-containing protein/diguanylate cyclase (GGDEF) domain-containing protein n=1 Tax=Parasphingorhabdus marina DSM 22363 TaxID=1123272 RepID=A0A1N6G425_9SPHN|nr:EAL domain-containing protein [Parasphingorhabdus marina]SIO02274.1 PAS domain S-box-containing protein/diguanylate cyclase (GGDEF) domain-containing protein [Parasphingorhabdus marina DSM 22363]